MLPDSRVRQRDYLLEISRAITQELDLDNLLGRILDISIEMVAGQSGVIVLRTESKGWHIHVSHGMPSPFLKYIEPFLVEIPSHPENAEIFEVPEINRIFTELTHAASMGMLTSVGLPLITHNSVLGVIFIFRSHPGGFSNNDTALLRSFADQAAIAVQNAKLYTEITHEKKRMDALLDSAADGILILTADHRIQHCNHALSRMLMINSTGIRDHKFEQIIQWASPPHGLTLEQAEAGGWPLTPHANLYTEGDLIRQDNLSTIPVGITYAPLLGADGVLLNIIATVRDITRFRQADEIKSSFISIISHELKTPVALIKGYVGTLRREDASWDPGMIKDSLQVIEEEADRLTDMIENLLDATRLQAGGLSVKRSDVCVPDMVERLVKRFQNQSTQHSIISDLPEDFPIILADENRLSQVVSNLVSNAIKYSPGGNITIKGHVRPESVIICVTDQGPGIAPGDIPYVFDRFYRAPDMAKLTKGAGLGLYLSKAIVEAHGGRMWVDGENDSGAKICFSLPRSTDE